MSGMFGRLYRGETTFNFVGRRWWGFGISIAFVVVTFISLFAQGLNLGIDFKGGVAWEVPATTITIEDVRAILDANNIPTGDAKIQVLNGADGKRIRAQVGEISTETRTVVQTALSAKAQVDVQEVSVASVSSSWGRSITEKAVRALLIFFVIVSMYIAWRFEWKMAIAAILAMVHDVLISVGVYATFGFSVTPATVIAFLTILGFSLYDTIVVFDKVHENTTRYSASKVSYGDIINVSMNQVLMRSINTSLAAVLPVLSLLVLGSWIMGAIALQEFALALLVGMLLGAYSSIYIATPLLAVFKGRELKFRSLQGNLRLGEEMARLGATSKKVVTRTQGDSSTTSTQSDIERETVMASSALSHPPRPRKNRRR
ncbi:MAG: protein translocase subunit SecF [Ilumatobacteraceae bacterium]|nr:protein translocase subunit SecF [Ilumatobacteraceae bacterium]